MANAVLNCMFVKGFLFIWIYVLKIFFNIEKILLNDIIQLDKNITIFYLTLVPYERWKNYDKIYKNAWARK